MVVYYWNPSTLGGWVLRPAWATLWVWSKPGLYLKQTNKQRKHVTFKNQMDGIGRFMPVTPDLQEAEAGRVQVQHLSGLKFKASWRFPEALCENSEGWRCSSVIAEPSVPVPQTGGRGNSLNSLCTDTTSFLGTKGLVKLSTQDSIQRLNIVFYLWIDI